MKHNIARDVTVIALSFLRQGKADAALATLQTVANSDQLDEVIQDLEDKSNESEAALAKQVTAGNKKSKISAKDARVIARINKIVSEFMADDGADDEQNEELEEEAADDVDGGNLEGAPDEEQVEAGDDDADADDEDDDDEDDVQARTQARLKRVQANRSILAKLKK